MDPIQPTPPPFAATPTSPSPAPRLGLAIASLVLGILALLASLLVVGALFGLVGLILGAAHLSRRTGRNGMAWAGVILSVLGIAVSIGLAVLYVPAIKQVMKTMQEMQQGGGADLEKWEGVFAPEISVKTLDGQTIKLSELKGKRVVLDFWATWCPPCVKEIPHFIQLRKETPDSELVIVGISSEDAETLKSFVKKHGINYPIASADDFPSPYKDVTGIPTTFFIDRKGVIQNVFVGYHDFDDLKKHALAADSVGEPRPTPTAEEEDESATETNNAAKPL